MSFLRKQDIETIILRLSDDITHEKVQEVIRLAQNGWQLEENIRIDHMKHCNGNEFCNWRIAHEMR